MAKIKVNPEFNLPLIAANAGQGDLEKIIYARGELHVEGVSQKALNDALQSYNHAVDAHVQEPSELEALKSALKSKGVLSDADISAAKISAKVARGENG